MKKEEKIFFYKLKKLKRRKQKEKVFFVKFALKRSAPKWATTKRVAPKWSRQKDVLPFQLL